MAKVLGVGGIFFKSPDPVKLQEWYSRWLGIDAQVEQGTSFAIFQPGTMPESAYTVWSMFDAKTEYFNPSGKEFMFNLVVDNLEEALGQVTEGGAKVVGDVEKGEFGNFGWFIDPDGNKVELWQPPQS